VVTNSIDASIDRSIGHSTQSQALFQAPNAAAMAANTHQRLGTLMSKPN
jgi:hypothetical protein